MRVNVYAAMLVSLMLSTNAIAENGDLETAVEGGVGSAADSVIGKSFSESDNRKSRELFGNNSGEHNAKRHAHFAHMRHMHQAKAHAQHKGKR